MAHLPAFAEIPNVTVSALCGTDSTRVEGIADQWGILHRYQDYQQMLASGEIDAVTLAVPPHLHHSMAVAACEESIHLLCEKPLATSAAEARDMEQMSRDSGVCHGVAFHRRFEPARMRMKELVEQGFIGDLHSVSVIVFRSTLASGVERPYGWMMQQELGGGVLSTIASHYVDQLRWWFGNIHAACGLTLTAVQERSDAGFGDTHTVDADDNTAFVMRFASGAIGSVNISYTAAADVGEEIVVSGSDGMLAIQEPDQLVGARQGNQVRSVMDRARPRPKHERRHVEPFSQLAAGWVAAIRSGTAFTPSFEDGARVQEVLDAVIQSQRLKRWIDLSGEKWPV